MSVHSFTDGEVVTASMLNSIASNSMTLLWDSSDAGVSLPAATITTPTLASSFAHLFVAWEGHSSNATSMEYLGVRVNGVSTANYYGQRHVNATGGAALVGTVEEGVTRAIAGMLPGSLGNSVYPGSGMLWIPNYSNSAQCHWIHGFSGGAWGAAAGDIWTGLFNYAKLDSSAAVTSLTFLTINGGNITAGSRFSVYGIGG